MTFQAAGILLRECRDAKGLSVRKAAKRVGLVHGSYAGLESGAYAPSVDRAKLIFDALDIHGDPRNKLIAIWGGGVLAKAAAWEKLKEDANG